MRYKNLLFAVVLGVLLPWFLLMSVKPMPTQDQMQITQYTDTTLKQEPELAVLQNDGSVCLMGFTDYLVGVLLAEMPASFEMEALKAQAIVARTFACKSMYLSKHENAVVCAKSSCCQGYMSEQDYYEQGGFSSGVQKIRNAVEATGLQVLTYDGQLIVATYFSCSGGRTEDALAVWGTDVPYLQATDSPGEEVAKYYMDTVNFTVAEFEKCLGALYGSGIGDISYTEGGGVDTIEIGGNLYTGTELRGKLGLRSTAFTIGASDGIISITTKGYGHRVGMSQYGANAMANNGSGYEEILYYYYKDTQLMNFGEMMV